MTTNTITFTTDGNGSCLYTELIDLHSIGQLEITRASTIEFNNHVQAWEVKNPQGRTLFYSRSRTHCLEWEQQNLGA